MCEDFQSIQQMPWNSLHCFCWSSHASREPQKNLDRAEVSSRASLSPERIAKLSGFENGANSFASKLQFWILSGIRTGNEIGCVGPSERWEIIFESKDAWTLRTMLRIEAEARCYWNIYHSTFQHSDSSQQRWILWGLNRKNNDLAGPGRVCLPPGWVDCGFQRHRVSAPNSCQPGCSYLPWEVQIPSGIQVYRLGLCIFCCWVKPDEVWPKMLPQHDWKLLIANATVLCWSLNKLKNTCA